jgi:hypothetical protein
MIFVDETGKRWKRLKLAGVGVGLIVAVPVGVLLAGSLVTPSWGQIPVVKQAGQLLGVTKPSTTSANPPKGQVKGVTTKATPKPTSSNKPTSPTPKPAATLAATTAPTITPSSADLHRNNDYGNSHKPSH